MFLLAFAESVQIMPDFALVVHVFIILIMIWVLNRTFFRPINKVINSRYSRTGGRHTESEEILEKASEKEERYRENLLKARNESYELIEGKRAEALGVKAEKVSMAKEEIAARTADQIEELERQKTTAKEAIDKDAEEIAEEISSSILKVA